MPPRRSPQGWVIGVVIAVVFLAVFVAFMLFASGLMGGLGGSTAFVCLPLFFVIIVLVIIVVAVIAVFARAGRSTSLPPPPPIQQPMVPAGMQGPVALSCPNCGAPPQNIDRFGVATCDHCETRFVVR